LKKNGNKLVKMVKISVLSIVLVQSLLFLPTTYAGSKVELAYDDGTTSIALTLDTGGVGEVGSGVHFSTINTLMLGTNETTVSGIRMYTVPGSYVWRILDWNETGDKPGSSVFASGSCTATETGWLEVDVGPVNVSREFFVGIYNSTPGGNVSLYMDNSNNTGRTRVISPGVPIVVSNNWLLRVIVDLPVNLQDVMSKLDDMEIRLIELEADLQFLGMYLMFGLNATLSDLQDNLTQSCEELNGTLQEMNHTIISRLDNLTLSCGNGTNTTLSIQLSNLTQSCEDFNETLLALNSTLTSRLDNLTQSCENVSQTVIEINAKIGEPSSTVFSDLEEILSKLDLLLERLGLAVGGTIIPVRELKLVLDTMSENLNTVIILTLFGIAVTWIAKKQTI
jgi:hypothetical protein